MAIDGRIYRQMKMVPYIHSNLQGLHLLSIGLVLTICRGSYMKEVYRGNFLQIDHPSRFMCLRTRGQEADLEPQVMPNHSIHPLGNLSVTLRGLAPEPQSELFHNP